MRVALHPGTGSPGTGPQPGLRHGDPQVPGDLARRQGPGGRPRFHRPDLPQPRTRGGPEAGLAPGRSDDERLRGLLCERGIRCRRPRKDLRGEHRQPGHRRFIQKLRAGRKGGRRRQDRRRAFPDRAQDRLAGGCGLPGAALDRLPDRPLLPLRGTDARHPHRGRPLQHPGQGPSATGTR